jgi:hypothetical protein
MLFLRGGVNYNVQNALGETAFMVFLRKNKIVTHRNGPVEIIYTMFLKKEEENLMDLDIQNNEGENVLFYVVRNNAGYALYKHRNIVTLMEGGIDLNVVNKEGVTAFFLLMKEYVKKNIEGILTIIDAFINEGYYINKIITVGDSKFTPFHFIVMALNDKPAEGDRLIFLATNMLNRYPIDVNIKDTENNTSLHILSKMNYKNLIELVIEKGADVNAQTIKGYTPLMIAVAKNHIDIVKLLLEKGADTKLKDSQGITAYDVATSNEMKELLKAKAKVKEKPYKGFSKSDMEIYDALFENPKDWSICPICLSFSERKAGCIIMGHDCSKQGIFYDKDLYKKYAFLNAYGNTIIEWCTICGRSSRDHKHYALSLPSDTPKLAIITPAMEARMQVRGTGVYFEDGNCIGLGGGGIEEKIARFRRLREYGAELQTQVGKITNTEALTELIEEIWKAPLFKSKKYKEALEKKKLNITTNVFPERIANNVEEEKVYRNVTFPSARKYPIKLGTEPECVIQGAVDESVSVKYQFQHEDVEGGSNHDLMYICNEDIENYIKKGNKSFGTEEFGKCWLPTCKAKIYPEEVEAIISKAIYEDYKKKFNRKFGNEIEGGNHIVGKKRNTRKKGEKVEKRKSEKRGEKGKKSRRKQRGGDIEHVFHKLDLDTAICLPFTKNLITAQHPHNEQQAH